MADNLASGGHVIWTNMTIELISAESVVPYPNFNIRLCQHMT